MRRLGAILAGGRATRFGGDKGAALLNGRALIDCVADGLRPQVDVLAVVGRDWPGLTRIEDAPSAGLGPLGGLCGALMSARSSGFDQVIVHPCDLLPVPLWPVTEVRGEALYAAGHFAAGIWPASVVDRLLAHIDAGGDRSMRGWIMGSGARAVECGPMDDLNTRAALNRVQGLAAAGE